ncbi:inorganic pyrophosphatase [Planctomycetales bacterium ZRK34]|nr:inorganic pyrophosphatase [Planctomycetales bacterium ZRK34]
MGFPDPFYRWRPHPWHGLGPGEDAPSVVLAYIELTPFDYVKYEVDKSTGYLRVDRPQRSSSQPPTLYGFVPQTYCGNRVGAMNPHADRGDHDPLDICVLTERPINRAEIILPARVIGGLQATDHGEADDKIIAVLDNDAVMKGVRDLKHLPSPLVERLRHYFLTYKMVPGEDSLMTIEKVYDREHAMRVVEASLADYDETFGK